MSNLETFAAINSRSCSILEIGGFPPTNDPTTSHFGLNPLARVDETWALNQHGEPMEFICQLNLTTAPYVPEILRDIHLITFFATNRFHIRDGSWCIRTYPSLENLVILEKPKEPKKNSSWQIERGFECKWSEATDHPVYDDPDLIELPNFDYSNIELQNQHRSKIGGYPSSIQSEVTWKPYVKYNDILVNSLQDKVKFAFQIDSEEKVGLCWGDSGTLYVGRGISEDIQGQWFVTMQCF